METSALRGEIIILCEALKLILLRSRNSLKWSLVVIWSLCDPGAIWCSGRLRCDVKRATPRLLSVALLSIPPPVFKTKGQQAWGTPAGGISRHGGFHTVTHSASSAQLNLFTLDRDCACASYICPVQKLRKLRLKTSALNIWYAKIFKHTNMFVLFINIKVQAILVLVCSYYAGIQTNLI